MHRAALTDQTRKRSPLTLTSIKARPSIGFHLFLRIFRNALLSRFILCSEKRRQAVPTKPQIIGCIITHNGEAQINASERDRATRGSQKLKKQQTVTPTIKANATAVRSQNTKYYILRHGLIRAPRLCDSPNLKRGINTAAMVISPAAPMARQKPQASADTRRRRSNVTTSDMSRPSAQTM